MANAIDKVVKQLSLNQTEEVSRWDVMGNVTSICNKLEASGNYQEWMHDFLLCLEDVAIESI